MRISSNSKLTDEQAKTFGREMRKRRIEAGISAKDFGTIIDCSQQYVYNIECGNRRPSPQLVERIVNVFGVEVSDMLDPALCESPDERREYGKKLFACRMNKKLNRSVVAGALGIPVEVYSEFERGECSISTHQKELLDKLLDIDKEPCVIKEVVVETESVPIHICDIILGHVKDLNIDSESQRGIWQYFMGLKISAEERELFG